MGIVLICILSLPSYWRLASEPLAGDLGHGVTAGGHPWFGAENPEIEILMFSDYQCFQCRKMHLYLRKLLSGSQKKIRVIHRHYPMDHEFNYIVKEPFHTGSGKMALIAIYAASKGKFWEVNNLLFDIARRHQQIDLAWIAAKTGLETEGLIRALQDARIRAQLKRDVWQGMKLRVLGTPSFVINGKVYAGIIPANVFQQYIK
jgi:protein-disulfide isomerase